jgi:diguanylate cyclase (GGDEF)-like protein/PAS domain S-box-containing protein
MKSMPLLSPSSGTWLERLHQRGELYKQIIETSLEGIWVIDAEGLTVFANEQMARILRCRREELIGAHLFAFTDAEGRDDCILRLEQCKQGAREQHEFHFRGGNGEDVWTKLATSPLLDQDGNYAGALAMVTDITPRKLAEQLLAESQREIERRVAERTEQLAQAKLRLEELVVCDPLTGVLNRRAFGERLQQEISRARRHDSALSALVLAVDCFDEIKDAHGHQAGDSVLRQLTSMIVQGVRDSDVVARYGGEEFVVLAPETARAGALVVAERIRRILALATDRSWPSSSARRTPPRA